MCICERIFSVRQHGRGEVRLGYFGGAASALVFVTVLVTRMPLQVWRKGKANWVPEALFSERRQSTILKIFS